MNLPFIFKNSLLLPKKDAVFQLNRVSMRDAMTYMVCLLVLLFLPDIAKMIMNPEWMTEGITYSTYIIQILVFYPFLILFLVVAGVSMLAFVSFGMAKMAGRKLTYHYLWKMTGYALTVPLMIYTILKLFQINHAGVNLILMLVLYFSICKIILIYPKISDASSK